MSGAANIDSCPISYARHIAYLGSAEKVHNRTMAYFGRAPSLDRCAKFVAERSKSAVSHTLGPACSECGEAITKENKSGLCRDCVSTRKAALRAALEAAPVAEPEPLPAPTTIPEPLFLPIGVIDKALHIAAIEFGVPRSVILSTSRKTNCVRARQAVMLIACELTSLSLPGIGKRLNRDHSTVIHGRDQALWRVGWDADYAAQVERLRQAVRG